MIFDAILRTKRPLPYPALMLSSRSIAWIGKEVYHILFEDTPLSNFCQLGGILSQRYATKNPCGVGWAILHAKSHQHRMYKRVYTIRYDATRYDTYDAIRYDNILYLQLPRAQTHPQLSSSLPVSRLQMGSCGLVAARVPEK